MVEFKTQFADKVDAQRMAACMAHGNRLAGKPREGFVGKIRSRQLLQNFARVGARQHQNAKPRGDRVELHRSIFRQQLVKRVMVMALIGTSGDEIETARRPFINRELGANPAMLRQADGTAQCAPSFLECGWQELNRAIRAPPAPTLPSWQKPTCPEAPHSP